MGLREFKLQSFVQSRGETRQRFLVFISQRQFRVSWCVRLVSRYRDDSSSSRREDSGMMLMQHLVHPIPMMQELDEEDDQSLPSPPSTSTTTATSNGFNGIRIHKIKELLQSKMTFIPASSTSTVQSIPYPAINDPPPPIKSIVSSRSSSSRTATLTVY